MEKRFCVPIDDEILTNHGPVYPWGVQNTCQTILKINDPAVMSTVSGKSVPSFELKDLKLK